MWEHELINFLLKNEEIVSGTKDFDENGNKLSKSNVRVWTKFFDSISGFSDFNVNLNKIMLIGGTSLPTEHLILFSEFINNKLDRLPSPSEMLNGKIKDVVKQLKSIIGEGEKRRNDLASILSKRLLNYCATHEEDLKKEEVEQFAQILENDLFTRDITHLVLRKTVVINKLKSFIQRPKLFEMYNG